MRFPPPPPWTTHITKRQFQVLTLLADGCTTKQIALRMSINLVTANSHVDRLYRRMGVQSRAEAVAVGFREKWLH